MITPREEIKVSAAWASHVIDCTLGGIQDRCHGRCCEFVEYWPPSSGDGKVCPMLSKVGCVLGEKRPIQCILSPFTFNSAGTLVLHWRTAQWGRCAPCHDVGGRMIIEVLAPTWYELFGKEQVDQAVEDVRNGVDPVLKVSTTFWEQIAVEEVHRSMNVQPTPREPIVGRADE